MVVSENPEIEGLIIFLSCKNIMSRFVIILYFIFSFCLCPCFSQKQKDQVKATKTPMNDFSVILHEETMNKVFEALGEITGTNDYSVLLIKGKYHWTIMNSRINLKPDSSDFTCDAKVEVGPFTYKTPVRGRVKIWFDNDKNKINVKITTAIFELYTKVFGKKIHIKDIELADYFKDPFQYDGPKTMGTEFEFFTPDSVKKKIYIKPCDCDITVRYKQIEASCEVTVSDKPIPDKVPVSNQTNKEATRSENKK